MASLKAVVGNANQLAAANDFTGALKICEEGIQTPDGSKLFALVTMHGFCAMSVGKYAKAEKSFTAAKKLDATPQMHQKNIKYLADTYAELGKWHEHAEELCHLYAIAKERGNMERVSVLASQITSSFVRCQEYAAGGSFVVDHLSLLSVSASKDEDGACNIEHCVGMLVYLHTLKAGHLSTHEEKKSAKTSIGTQVVVAAASVFDHDLLADADMYRLALRCVRQLAGEEEGEGVAESQSGPLMSLLLDHLQSFRAEVFRTPSTPSPSESKEKSKGKGDSSKPSAPAERVTYQEVFSLAQEVFSATCSLLPPASSASPLPCSCFLQVCQILLECWFFTPEEGFEGLVSEAVQKGRRVAAAVVHREKHLSEGEEASSSASAAAISSFLASAQILQFVSIGDKASAISLSQQVTPQWVSAIRKHQQVVSSSRKDTMKTPTTSFQLSTIELRDSSEAAATTLGLCVAACVGALNGFRGDTFRGQLSVADGLYLTQEVVSRVLSLKKILMALEHSSLYMDDTSDGAGAEGVGDATAWSFSRGQLRPSLLQLVPLGRMRILFQIKQTKAAFSLCLDQRWLLSIPTSEEEGAEGLRVNGLLVADMLPVSSWVLLHTLAGGGSGSWGGDLSRADREDLMASMAALATSSSPDSLFASLLNLDKAWLSFGLQADHALEKSGQAELSFTADLLRERTVCTAAISAITTKLQGLVSAASSPYLASYTAEMVQFRVGVAMWLGEEETRSDKTKCLAQLIKTAKLDPHFGGVYSFIGHYYLLILKDTARASKCYIKALAFDPIDAEAGISLSQIYIEADELTKVHKLWSDINALTVSHSYWCFSLSGQLNFCLQNYEESIQDFQRSLELRRRDLASWHSLSASYSSLGQSVAASKSLTRALTLLSQKTPEQQEQWADMRIILMCELAEVERRMGSFYDAFDRFEEVRQLTVPSPSSSASADHVTALKGIGDVCLALGYKRLTCGWTRGACAVVTRGIEAMDLVLGLWEGAADREHESGVLACLLKLKGDLCSFCRNFSPADNASDARLRVRQGGERFAGSGVVVNVQTVSYDWIISRLVEAEVTYRQLLGLLERKQKETTDEEDASGLVSVWCDIGSALFHQASLHLASRGQGSGMFSTSFLLSSPSDPAAHALHKAQEAFAQGLLLQPGHSGCWNGAGVCCLSLDDSLRERCLVRSTQPQPGDAPNPAGYANLGSLFLAHNQQESARECLSALQLLESNPLHWLVLGGLLEKSPPADKLQPDGEEGSGGGSQQQQQQHRQSVMDAYSAALEVSKPAEGLLGLAVAHLRLHGLLKAPREELAWSGHPSWPLQSLDRVALRYCVENPVSAFLYRRPRHPFAWGVLAWAYIQRQAWELAAEAYLSLLRVVELLLAESGLSHEAKGGEEEEYCADHAASLTASAVRGLELCRRMMTRSSSPAVSLPELKREDFPCIERMCPQFMDSSGNQSSSLTEENMILKVFEERQFTQCRALLLARKAELLDSVQPLNVDQERFLRPFIRWMQMVGYFVEETDQSPHELERGGFLDCLLPVGHLLTGNGGDPCDMSAELQCQRGFVLNVLRLHPDGLLLLGQALMNADLRPAAVAVLDLGLSMHPRHDGLLRMLGRADPTMLQSAAEASLQIVREMVTASAGESGLIVQPAVCCQPVAWPSPQSEPLPMSNQQGGDSEVAPAQLTAGARVIECTCPQRKVDCMEEVLSSYSASVTLSCAHTVQTGQQCSRRHRKDLLTALWLDPANAHTWAALAGSIFSDITLGPKGSGGREWQEGGAVQEDQGEAEGVAVGGRRDLPEVGVFADQGLMKTCMDIISLLARSSASGCMGRSSGVGAFSSREIDLSLVYDWGSYCFADDDRMEDKRMVHSAGAEELQAVMQLVTRARKKCFSGSFHESVPLYEEAIRELTTKSTQKSFMSQLLIELGNVFFFLYQPEKACEMYKLSETFTGSSKDSSVSSLTHLFCAVAFTRRAAVGGDYQDVTSAREHAEAACEACTTRPSSHAAAGHLVKALVWLGLSKPNKVQQEVKLAEAICPSVDVPF